ncbi:MAG TPA: hypothetical protein VIJ12_01580 [Candidatus Baltobacteraceae bacterium]
MAKSAPTIGARVTRILIWLFGAALVLEEATRFHSPRHDPYERTFWAHMMAPMLFWFALNAAVDAMFRLRAGEPFGPSLIKALEGIGGYLMAGAFAAIVVQPSLLYLIGNGFTEMAGVQFDLNVETVTIALVGFVLYLLARQGQKLQSALDEFV